MRRLLLPLIAFCAAACEGPTIPPDALADVYDFRLETDPPSVLRWTSGTRVRVFAGESGARDDQLREAFASAAAEWNRHALYGEYELVPAESVREADVLLRWSDEPAPVDLSQCRPVVSTAVTTFCLSAADPARLEVFPLLPPDDDTAGSIRFVITILGSVSGDADRIERLVVHELGHALGIARHSLDPQDLMTAGEPPRTTLSRRDAATVLALYHTEPRITP